MHIIDKCKGTLKQASYDEDNNEYMVNSNLEVCIFDDVKEYYVKNMTPLANPNPKSNDALYFSENEGFFIEFKNGRIDNKVNFQLNKKIYDSLFILFDLQYEDKNGKLVNSPTYCRKNMNYILVYNSKKYAENPITTQTKEGFDRQEKQNRESVHRDKLYKAVRGLAKEDFIKFGLDQFKNYLFKNVYTYTEKEFQERFLDKYSVT